jgi:chitinase
MRPILFSALVVASALCTVRADTSCSAEVPCALGCCSIANKICGYGPDYCAADKCNAVGSANGTCAQLSECDPGKYPGWGTVWGSTYAAAENCPLNVCCSEFGFCGTTTDFCGSATVAEPNCNANGSSSAGRNIAYYELFSQDCSCDVMTPEEIPIGGYTHINVAFIYLDPNTFELAPMESNQVDLYSRTTALKNVQQGLQVWISIGGWDFNDPGATASTFSELVGNFAAQNAFFSSLVNFLEEYKFDGVDFDW